MAHDMNQVKLSGTIHRITEIVSNGYVPQAEIELLIMNQNIKANASGDPATKALTSLAPGRRVEVDGWLLCFIYDDEDDEDTYRHRDLQVYISDIKDCTDSGC